MRKELRVSTGVLVTAEDKILLGFHLETQAWRMPGGWQEPPENLLECAIREVEEETGLKIRYKVKGDTCWIEAPPALVIGYLADIKHLEDPKNPEPHKFSEWRWFDFDKIPRPLFEPSEQILNYFSNLAHTDWKHFDE